MAFNFGGAISGGMGGAGTAAALGLGAATGGVGLLPWAIGTGLAGAAAGGLMGGQGESGYTPYQFLQNPQYAWREGDLKTVSDSARGNIQSIMQGEIPWWQQRLADDLRSQSNRQLQARFMGLPGQQAGSVLGIAEQGAAQTGLGAPALQQSIGNATSQYMQQLMDVEAAINQYQLQQIPSLLSNQQAMILQSPEGPSGQWVGGQAYSIPGQGAQIGPALASMAGTLGQLDLGGGQTPLAQTAGVTGGGYGSYPNDARYLPGGGVNPGGVYGMGDPNVNYPVSSGPDWQRTLQSRGVTAQPRSYGFNFGPTR